MRIAHKTYAILAVSMGLAAWASADEIIGTVVEPVAAAPAPVVVPVAVSTYPVTYQVVPVADAHRSRDEVTWNKLEGMVQSVDRDNRALTVQDNEGKNVRVVFNDRIHIYRRGEQIPYSQVEPNDNVVLRYTSQESRHYADE